MEKISLYLIPKEEIEKFKYMLRHKIFYFMLLISERTPYKRVQNILAKIGESNSI